MKRKVDKMERYLTRKEAAKYYHCSLNTLDNAIEKGQIKTKEVGEGLRIDREATDAGGGISTTGEPEPGGKTPAQVRADDAEADLREAEARQKIEGINRELTKAQEAMVTKATRDAIAEALAEFEPREEAVSADELRLAKTNEALVSREEACNAKEDKLDAKLAESKEVLSQKGIVAKREVAVAEREGDIEQGEADLEERRSQLNTDIATFEARVPLSGIDKFFKWCSDIKKGIGNWFGQESKKNEDNTISF